MATWLGSIAALAFVMAATPGPNNLVFAAAGASVGYRATLPMLLGMLLGFVCLIALGAMGSAGILLAAPGAHWLLSAAASAYMLYLTSKLWRATPPPPVDERPPDRVATWWHMALFQVVNPKTWLAVLAFVTGKLGPHSPGHLTTDLLGVVCFLAVIASSASLWTLFGAALRRKLEGEAWKRAMKTMAGLALVTIPSFWL